MELWNASMDRVLAWGPRRIVPTHFGPSEDPPSHFRDLRRDLARWAERVRQSLEGEDPVASDGARDLERARRFAEWVEADVRARMPAEPIDAYKAVFGFDDAWWGLARYWRKRAT